MHDLKGSGLGFSHTKKGDKPNAYITTCVRCRFGIFKDHEYEWSGGDGLVHIDCNDPRMANAET